MKREDVRRNYENATSKLSANTRQLALAGIAVIWLIRTGDIHAVLVFRPVLNYSLLLFVLALGFDLLQYTYQSIAWATFNKIKELQNVSADKNFLAPRSINWTALVFFGAR